jgi:hypothetical protein
MKTVTIRCEHTDTNTHLRVSESKICFIQCGLIQIVLSHAQATKVRRHCHCMLSKLQYEQQHSQGRATMTIDPSQLDVRGEYIDTPAIG